MSLPYQSVSRKLYPLFTGVSSHLFFRCFSLIPLVRFFAKIRIRVFTVNIMKKHLHVTTWRWIEKIGVRFLPSTATTYLFVTFFLHLKPVRHLNGTCEKKNYICTATYVQFDNIDVKSCAAGSFNNGNSSLKSARVNWFFTLLVKLTLESNLSSLPFIRRIFGVIYDINVLCVAHIVPEKWLKF